MKMSVVGTWKFHLDLADSGGVTLVLFDVPVELCVELCARSIKPLG
jgi:hypothetical protein